MGLFEKMKKDAQRGIKAVKAKADELTAEAKSGDFWEKMKKDVRAGTKKGMHALKTKADKLSEEGKKQYRIFNLKTSIQKEMAELGASVYKTKAKNPMLDGAVKSRMAKIKKLHSDISRLEGKTARKKTAKKKAAR